MKVRSLRLTVLLLCSLNAWAGAVSIDLGTADLFAVLAGSNVSNRGATYVQGDVGVWPGAATADIPTGFITSGPLHFEDPIASMAQNHLIAAYNLAASEPCGSVLTGENLGGLTLTPGVYCFSSPAQLTGKLTLNAEGNPGAIFLFQIGGALTTAANSSVVYINGDKSNKVYWQVGSSATLGSQSTFVGNVLAMSTIALNAGASIQCGSILTVKGAIALNTNSISLKGGDCEAAASAIPEPNTAVLLSLGFLVSMVGANRKGALKAATSWIRRPTR